MGIILFIIVGLVAGFLANLIMNKDRDIDFWDFVLGVAGSFVGGLLIGPLLRPDADPYTTPTFGGDLVWDVIFATIGAIILVFIARLLGYGRRGY